MLLNMHHELMLLAHLDVFGDGIKIYGAIIDQALPYTKRLRSVAQPATFRDLTDEERENAQSGIGNQMKPMLELSHEQAQRLMDQLYEAGVRPTHERSQMGALPKMQEHLADLRKIAFHALKMEPPKP